MLQTGNFDTKEIEKIGRQEPVMGYGGFLKGVKAENQYGQNFRDLAKKSFNCWYKYLYSSNLDVSSFLLSQLLPLSIALKLQNLQLLHCFIHERFNDDISFEITCIFPHAPLTFSGNKCIVFLHFIEVLKESWKNCELSQWIIDWAMKKISH